MLTPGKTEFKMQPGYGYADYLLFVDGRSVGALEAKRDGFTLAGVEPQVASVRAAGAHPR